MSILTEKESCNELKKIIWTVILLNDEQSSDLSPKWIRL